MSVTVISRRQAFVTGDGTLTQWGGRILDELKQGAGASGNSTVDLTDSSASAGPSFTLDRNSSSPAANDAIGEIVFRGRDSGGNTSDYARLYGTILDPTNASEDGALTVATRQASAEADVMHFRIGAYMQGATGGDQGAGTLNATGLYVNGAAAYHAGGTDVALADGGTGASTAADARTNLGLGTIATQDASSVAITGGTADLGTLQVGSGASITGILTATATLDFPSISAQSSQELTITVTGAQAGDSVIIAAPSTIEANLVVFGYVSATDTVTVRAVNATGAAIDPASATFRATVIRI